jgi:Tfp pilus assembly protein PilE
VQDLIRRAEAFRQWADIEDLAASIDQITAVFE